MPPKGYKQSPEAIAKMRAKKSGSNNPMFGRNHSKESKDKIRDAKVGSGNVFYGKKHSEETKRKMSESKKGNKNSFYGKKHSEESKAKNRDAHIGLHPKEHYQKIGGTALLGKHHTEDTKSKIGAAHKGKTFPEPYRTKLVEGGVGGFWYGNVRYYDGPQYCEKWTESLRERVRAYFGNTCLLCGTPQNGRKLVVHHVWYNKKTCCDDSPRSLVPLCQSCHAETNFNREYWSEYFQHIIDTYYDGKCWLSREEYATLTKDISSLET